MDYNWPEITTETTMEELQEIHKRIWQYFIENHGKPNTPYINGCVGCEWSAQSSKRYVDCENCPIDWGEFGKCGDYQSLYTLLLEFMGKERHMAAVRLAFVIRDLPFHKPQPLPIL